MSASVTVRDRSVDSVAAALKCEKLKRVVAIVGAGISTASGIPDFRSKNGLYGRLRRMGIDDPESVFTKEWFDNNKKTYYEIVSRAMPRSAQPTTAHRFLKWLDDRKKLARLYTQNIDGLEFKAGISPDKIVQIHGTSRRFLCGACGVSKTDEELDGIMPRCDRCEEIMRPDVVFFGERVKMGNGSMRDFKECDALIVMGTSLSVYPCASFVNEVGSRVPRIIINDAPVEWPSLGAKSERVFDFQSEHVRDVLLLGDVQDLCAQIMSDP